MRSNQGNSLAASFNRPAPYASRINRIAVPAAPRAAPYASEADTIDRAIATADSGAITNACGKKPADTTASPPIKG